MEQAVRISTSALVKWTLLALVLACYGMAGIVSGGWLMGGVGALSLVSSVGLGWPLAAYFRDRFFS